jgi:hypothetical protein
MFNKKKILENAPVYLEEVRSWMIHSLSPINESWTIGHFLVFIKKFDWVSDDCVSRRFKRIVDALVARFPHWEQIVINAKQYYFQA